jgi:WD40 repeat protein
VGGDDKIVKFYETATGQERDLGFPRVPYSVSALAFSPDSRYLVLGCDGCLTLIWDLGARREAHQLEGHVEWTGSLAFSSQGNLFVSGGEDGAVKLWDATSGHLVREFAGHGTSEGLSVASVASVAFSPDERRAASASGRSVKLWDVTTGGELATLTPPIQDMHEWMLFVAFRSQVHQIVSGTNYGDVQVWDLPDHH